MEICRSLGVEQCFVVFHSQIRFHLRSYVCFPISRSGGFGMRKSGVRVRLGGIGLDLSVCHSKLLSPLMKAVLRAYDRHRSKVSSKQRALNVLLVVGDCVLDIESDDCGHWLTVCRRLVKRSLSFWHKVIIRNFSSKGALNLVLLFKDMVGDIFS
ncbi:putative nucleotide-sugar transporter [Dioscorea sansibarensis]